MACSQSKFPGLILENRRTPLRKCLSFKRSGHLVKSHMLQTLAVSPKLECLTPERGKWLRPAMRMLSHARLQSKGNAGPLSLMDSEELGSAQ